MKDIHTARSNFPYLESGKIYFNHASTGPISGSVKSILNEIITEKSEIEIDGFKKFLRISAETKTFLGEMINTESDRISFTDNTSNGINILAQSIEWKRGDRIVLNDLEFPANVYPFLNLQKAGVIIDIVKSHNGIVTADDIIREIKPETRLISVSQVQFLTGYRTNLEKLGRVCRAEDIILSVDAIQGLGAVRLDVKKQNIDFISSGTQKWLLGLQGFGFIYISEKLQEKIKPRFVGWISVKDAWNLLDYNMDLKSTAECFQTGTINTLGVFALNASLKFFREYGFDFIEERVVSNSEYLIKKLEGIGLEPVLSGIPKANTAGIVSFKSPDSERLFEDLAKSDINCAVREGMIRFSPHFYNTYEDTDKVIDVLSNILK